MNAAARGVEVCLIFDYIGCFDSPGAYFKELERRGWLVRLLERFCAPVSWFL